MPDRGIGSIVQALRKLHCGDEISPGGARSKSDVNERPPDSEGRRELAHWRKRLAR